MSSREHTTSTGYRANQFLQQVEVLTLSAEDRQTAFNGIFGLGGLYVTSFPTMEERLAFRDVRLARSKLFTLLWRVPTAKR
jgi:hypothetical protein